MAGEFTGDTIGIREDVFDVESFRLYSDVSQLGVLEALESLADSIDGETFNGEKAYTSYDNGRELDSAKVREAQKILFAELNEYVELQRQNNPDFNWIYFVACKANPDIFVSEKKPETKEAKRICNTECPVKEECLADALKHPDEPGIRGGMTKRERLIWLEDQRYA